MKRHFTRIISAFLFIEATYALPAIPFSCPESKVFSELRHYPHSRNDITDLNHLLYRNNISPSSPHDQTEDLLCSLPLFADTLYKIIPAANGTYGYEIWIDRKIYIRQKNIPGRPGVNGFISKKEAASVARLVLQKISGGLIPPAVTRKELEELHIHFN